MGRGLGNHRHFQDCGGRLTVVCSKDNVGAAIAFLVGIATLLLRPIRQATAMGITLLTLAALAGAIGFVQCGLAGLDDYAPC